MSWVHNTCSILVTSGAGESMSWVLMCVRAGVCIYPQNFSTASLWATNLELTNLVIVIFPAKNPVSLKVALP